MKRLIVTNRGPAGSLNTDSLAADLMSYRNNPDRDMQRSPAQILFARQIKDAIPCSPENLKLRQLLTAEMPEKALSHRHLSIQNELLSKSKTLKPLKIGDVVQVQNQCGNHGTYPAQLWRFIALMHTPSKWMVQAD